MSVANHLALDRASLDWAIRKELRRHRVLNHYKNSAKTGRTTYAVFVDGKQHCETGSHREMQQVREDLITSALIALFEQAAA